MWRRDGKRESRQDRRVSTENPGAWRPRLLPCTLFSALPKVLAGRGSSKTLLCTSVLEEEAGKKHLLLSIPQLELLLLIIYNIINNNIPALYSEAMEDCSFTFSGLQAQPSRRLRLQRPGKASAHFRSREIAPAAGFASQPTATWTGRLPSTRSASEVMCPSSWNGQGALFPALGKAAVELREIWEILPAQELAEGTTPRIDLVSSAGDCPPSAPSCAFGVYNFDRSLSRWELGSLCGGA